MDLKNNNKNTDGDDALLCANGCGFYGHPSTQNLCSKCFQDSVFLQAISNLRITDSLSSSSTSTTAAAAEGASSSSTATMKNRCQICKKKIGLLGFRCRCGGSFCGIHRYPENHSCAVDYKTSARFAIAKENPLCKSDKLRDRV